MQDVSGDHYIDGAWVKDAPNGHTDSISPANGDVVGQPPNGFRDHAYRAVDAARGAFETLAWTSGPRQRAQGLLDFADALEGRADETARLLAMKNGKILGQTRHEIAAGYGEARYYAGLARNIFGRTFESGPSKLSMMTREPSGVVSVIVPWNAPVTLLLFSAAPALSAGCTVVIKPALQTPLTKAAVMASQVRQLNR